MNETVAKVQKRAYHKESKILTYLFRGGACLKPHLCVSIAASMSHICNQFSLCQLFQLHDITLKKELHFHKLLEL